MVLALIALTVLLNDEMTTKTALQPTKALTGKLFLAHTHVLRILRS